MRSFYPTRIASNTYVTIIKVQKSYSTRQVNIIEKLTRQNWLILFPQWESSRRTTRKYTRLGGISKAINKTLPQGLPPNQKALRTDFCISDQLRVSQFIPLSSTPPLSSGILSLQTLSDSKMGSWPRASVLGTSVKPLGSRKSRKVKFYSGTFSLIPITKTLRWDSLDMYLSCQLMAETRPGS